jgi:hypothetical protein
MANNFAYGVDAQFAALVETTYGTNEAFDTNDGVGLIDLKLDGARTFEESKERVGSASAQAMIPGMYSGKWSASSEVKTQAAGTAPDNGEMIRAAMGTETVSGGVSVTYSLSSNTPSLQLARKSGLGFYEVANGAWVEQFDLEVQGNTAPKISWSGGYATHGWVYGAQVNTNASGGASSVLYKTAHKGNLGKNGLVRFGTEDNGGAGYLITAVDDTTSPPSITISPVLDNNISADDDIIPMLPAPTLAGTLLGGINASLTVDGTSVNFVSAKISVKTGFHGRDKEASADRSTGIMRGKREVTGEIQVYFIDKESGPVIGRAWSGTTRALALRFGANTAGQRMKLNIPNAHIDVTPVEMPEAEEAMATIKFRALESAAANDEFNIVFD